LLPELRERVRTHGILERDSIVSETRTGTGKQPRIVISDDPDRRMPLKPCWKCNSGKVLSDAEKLRDPRYDPKARPLTARGRRRSRSGPTTSDLRANSMNEKREFSPSAWAGADVTGAAVAEMLQEAVSSAAGLVASDHADLTRSESSVEVQRFAAVNQTNPTQDLRRWIMSIPHRYPGNPKRGPCAGRKR
jgi:hypothetical protein